MQASYWRVLTYAFSDIAEVDRNRGFGHIKASSRFGNLFEFAHVKKLWRFPIPEFNLNKENKLVPMIPNSQYLIFFMGLVRGPLF